MSKLDDGLISPVDAVMILNPHLNAQEAKLELDQHKQENKTMNHERTERHINKIDKLQALANSQEEIIVQYCEEIQEKDQIISDLRADYNHISKMLEDQITRHELAVATMEGMHNSEIEDMERDAIRTEEKHDDQINALREDYGDALQTINDLKSANENLQIEYNKLKLRIQRTPVLTNDVTHEPRIIVITWRSYFQTAIEDKPDALEYIIANFDTIEDVQYVKFETL